MDTQERRYTRGGRATPAPGTRLRAVLGGTLLCWLAACGSEPAAPTATLGPGVVATLTAVVPTSTSGPGTSTAATTPTGPPATATVAAATATFQNPVLEDDFPDPFILTVGNTYYAYATNGSGKNIQRARSTDLVHWEILSDALPALPSWAQLGGSLVWAPEVLAVNQGYVMYYTARDTQSDKQCIGVAVGSTPDGRFKDTNDKPFMCQPDQGGDIDPDVFRDGDKLYFYWKNDGNCCGLITHIYGQELSADGLHLVGDKAADLEENDQLWEGRVVEAPTMVKHGGHYYLFYSGNDYAGLPYAVGYAACDGPLGPCRDAPENPVLKSNPAPPPVVGPGHQSIVQVGDQTWIVYHVWEMVGGLRGDRRFLWIDRITWEGDKPHVQGPTIGPQPLPGSAPP